jgi:hypothetical protein
MHKQRSGSCGVYSITLFLAAGFLALLAGCETAPELPAEDLYQPPPPGAPAATLRGSNIIEPGLFGSEHRGFVTMVDLKTVTGAADHWSEPITLAPGKHTIVAEYHYSNFMARAFLPLEAKAGASYQLLIKNGHQGTPEGQLYNDFWIVDMGTGQPVTQIYRRQATGGKKGTIFNNDK